jgi:hypothetical protein
MILLLMVIYVYASLNLHLFLYLSPFLPTLLSTNKKKIEEKCDFSLNIPYGIFLSGI